MNSNSVFQGDYVSLLRNISKTALNPASNIIELLENTLRVMGDSLGTNLCAIYEASRSDGFRFMCGYKLESSCEADCLIQLVRKHAEDSLQNHKITFTHIEGSKLLYIMPLITDRTLGVIILGFNNEIHTNEMEILASISDILSTTIDRFFLQQQISRQYFSTVKSLVVAIEAKDVYTQGHSQRVSEYSKIIGRHLMLKDEVIKEIEITGLVHDVGKIGVSDQLLTKPNRLTDAEFDSISQHPEIGVKILQPLNVSENVMLGTFLHHKRYDLKGYPLEAGIDKLPLIPAIIGVADSFDAMTSERSYKKAMTKQNAVAELKLFRGTQFHPDIVDIVEELIDSNKL
ncbi:MAG: hypothetical protein A2Y23_09300 [Clostridiales bacterium GWB2_37_7]|nr:MAG: hypothetical protein A2Y23_09300 [Clostridiales bacterium GWB2_37_7]